MAYEDPNAPSPTSGDYAPKPAAPVDQSKTFLGGNIIRGGDCSRARSTSARQVSCCSCS